MKITKVASAIAASAIALTSLVGCSSGGNPEETVSAQIELMLEKVQLGEVQEAVDMFDSRELLSFGNKVSDVPEMSSKYTKIKIDSVEPYGRGKDPGYRAKFSFNIGKDRVSQEIQAKIKNGKVRFTSSPSKMFGSLVISSDNLTDGLGGQPPYPQMDGLLIEIGGIPFMPAEEKQESLTINWVPIGNYAVSVRPSEYVSFDVEDGSTLEFRPGPSDQGLVNMEVRRDAADKVAQDNWDGLKSYILKCAQVDMAVCDTSSSDITKIDNYWNISSESLYLKSIDWESSSGNATSGFMSNEESSRIFVPVTIGGVIQRDRKSDFVGEVIDKELAATAEIWIDNNKEVGYKVTIGRSEGEQ